MSDSLRDAIASDDPDAEYRPHKGLGELRALLNDDGGQR